MKADILSQTDWMIFPLISVVFFTAIFLGVIAWILRPGAGAVYAKRSQMVFDDERQEASK